MRTDEHVERLRAFLERIERDTYPEPPTAGHTQITEQMVDMLLTEFGIMPGATVLDIGCGQGVALEVFRRKGLKAIGIALGEEDVQAACEKGFDVRRMDQSFLDFEDGSFDVLWSRHCLEHSIFPYFTLWGMFRVLKPGGHAYVEVPAPDTACQHQTNPNHYSVLPHSMWCELFARAGFQLKKAQALELKTGAGPDAYWVNVLQRPRVATA